MRKMRLVLAAAALCAPLAASAVPITIDFTVTTTMSHWGGAIDPGYQAGVVGSGYFTFDDSIKNPYGGGAFYEFGVIDASVSWLGTSWDESNTQVGHMTIQYDGSITSWSLQGLFPGNTCGGCVDPRGPTDFWVGINNGPFSSLIHLAELPGHIYASTSWSIRPATVPEPGTVALMSLGLLGIGLATRRRARS